MMWSLALGCSARKATTMIKREQSFGLVLAMGAACFAFAACGGRSVGDDSDAGTAGSGGATGGAGGSSGSGGSSGTAGHGGNTGGAGGVGPCENVGCDAFACGEGYFSVTKPGSCCPVCEPLCGDC